MKAFAVGLSGAVLLALAAGCQPQLAEVELDYEAMNRKREFELNRLGEVISYATARKCRQACLISYFGESTDGWSCGSCDNCREIGLAVRRAPSAGEEEIIQVILGCIGDFVDVGAEMYSRCVECDIGQIYRIVACLFEIGDTVVSTHVP